MKCILLLSFFAMNAQAFELSVLVKNRKSAASKIIFGYFLNADGFPMDNKKVAAQSDAKRNEDGSTTCDFKDVKEGKIAVAVQEDLNGNGKMDLTFVGYPKEPWGVSKVAPMHTFGPPTFDEAALIIKENIRITISLNQP